MLNALMLNVVMLNVVMLSVNCQYTECHYAECCGASRSDIRGKFRTKWPLPEACTINLLTVVEYKWVLSDTYTLVEYHEKLLEPL